MLAKTKFYLNTFYSFLSRKILLALPDPRAHKNTHARAHVAAFDASGFQPF